MIQSNNDSLNGYAFLLVIGVNLLLCLNYKLNFIPDVSDSHVIAKCVSHFKLNQKNKSKPSQIDSSIIAPHRLSHTLVSKARSS